MVSGERKEIMTAFSEHTQLSERTARKIKPKRTQPKSHGKRTGKSLQEQNLIDDFLFYSVMQEPKIAHIITAALLEQEIGPIHYAECQKEIRTQPRFHGIRLDVFLEEESGRRYNLEVQVKNKKDLPKRSRFYQSVMDYRLLPSGEKDYNVLPDTTIVFICSFDYFKDGRCRHVIGAGEQDTYGEKWNSGARVIVYNTRGVNSKGLRTETLELLRYFENTQAAYAKACSSPMIREIQRAVDKVRGKEEEALKLEEIIYDSRMEGRQEGRQEGQQEGRQKLSRQLMKLSQIYMKENREKDLMRVLSDEKYRERQFRKYRIR